MQKDIFITLLFLSLVASCDKDEDTPVAETHPIEFLLSTEPVRSRTELVDSYLDVDNIGVFAFAQGSQTPFADNLFVWRKYREWRCESQIAWEDHNATQTTFLAYSPYVTSTNGIDISVESESFELTYTAPLNGAYHPYLMVSFPDVCAKEFIEPVLFVMQHVLCPISFASDDYKIIKIEISGVATRSTLSLLDNGVAAWGELSLFDRVVSATEDSYIMMIPQSLGTDSKAYIYFEDGVATFSLDGEVWEAHQSVNYIVDPNFIYPTLI